MQPTLRKHSNKTWYIHWMEGRRSRRISTSTRDRAVALGVLQDFHNRLWTVRGRSLVAPRLDHVWKEYWKGHVERHVTAPDALMYAWKNLSAYFAKLGVNDFKQSAINHYCHKRETGQIGRKVQPATVRKEISALIAAINWCAKYQMLPIKQDDIPSFRLPESGEPRDRWLRDDEIERLVAAAARNRHGSGKISRVELFLWIALQTAARKTAILDLTWDRVHFDIGVIHFNVPGRRRTKKRRADVPISDALRPILMQAWHERENEFVLKNKGAVWQSIQLLARDAGLTVGKQAVRRSPQGKPSASGISPNVLRHTAATHMARRGVPLWIIAKVMGNSLTMVERVYAKWVPEDLRNAVNQITPRPDTEHDDE